MVHYLETMNPTEAARRAGYPGSYRDLLFTGAVNLDNPLIINEIKKGKKIPVRKCKACQSVLVRIKKPNGKLESIGSFNKRKHCDSKCAEFRDRPADWQKNHAEARKLRKDKCEACGLAANPQAHHIDGNPKNNTKDNIQTLCAHCHHFLHAVMSRLKLSTPGEMPVMFHVEQLNQNGKK